jgi:hypothetical protein
MMQILMKCIARRMDQRIPSVGGDEKLDLAVLRAERAAKDRHRVSARINPGSLSGEGDLVGEYGMGSDTDDKGVRPAALDPRETPAGAQHQRDLLGLPKAFRRVGSQGYPHAGTVTALSRARHHSSTAIIGNRGEGGSTRLAGKSDRRGGKASGLNGARAGIGGGENKSSKRGGGGAGKETGEREGQKPGGEE